MSTLARIWFILVVFGVIAIAGEAVAVRNRIREPEPTVLTWAQFVEKMPDKTWFRIEDAPVVDARTVRLVRKKKIGTAEEAYVPVVTDPSAPMGPVKVFLHVNEGDVQQVAPTIAAGVPPTVRRAPLEGRRINLAGETRELLARQAPPVAPDVIVLRAGPRPPLWYSAVAALVGLGLALLGLKARAHRARAQAELPAETAA